ncbi:DHA2 family efflux MFS transporter permease subunit [Conexibacter woesei]|uniref:DHA2 family efflux MFS transporter permease subunit n=1 Tax=Conexibacter woesei TaxID=191495 RepID=UPI000422D7EE|nr:DHA2 family efflux MFS transporter permease subunit [Conexibacter woesei]
MLSSLKDPKRLSLVAAIMGSFVVGLDATVVNVALPSISDDLGGGLAGQQWVSNAYLLALGSLILIGGSLGDLLGERRVFAIGVGGFGAVSLLCALAPSMDVLIAGRALQGVFGALLTPSALAVIVSAFPPDERGGAIGSWTAWSGIATVIGPLCGGYLIDATSWRWIFAINIPFVVITLMLILVAVPKRERDTRHAPIDWVGAVLCALGLAGPVFALIRQPALGWGAPGVLIPAVAGIALFLGFLVWESRVAHPMLPLGLFARRNFAVGNAQTFAMYGGLGITFFFLVLFLQQVAGYDALQAGLATVPATVVMFLLSKRAGRLADRFGPRLFMGLGPLIAAAGLALMQRVGADPDYWTDVFPAILLFAVGLSATVAPLTATVLADADEQNAGIASGVNNAVARVASLLAVAALGAVVSSSFTSSIDSAFGGSNRVLSPAGAATVAHAKRQTLATADVSGLPPEEAAEVSAAVTHASVKAFHLGMGLSTGLVAIGGILGLVGIVNPRREVRCEDCAGGALVGVPQDAAAGAA